MTKWKLFQIYLDVSVRWVVLYLYVPVACPCALVPTRFSANVSVVHDYWKYIYHCPVINFKCFYTYQRLMIFGCGLCIMLYCIIFFYMVIMFYSTVSFWSLLLVVLLIWSVVEFILLIFYELFLGEGRNLSSIYSTIFY